MLADIQHIKTYKAYQTSFDAEKLHLAKHIF